MLTIYLVDLSTFVGINNIQVYVRSIEKRNREKKRKYDYS